MTWLTPERAIVNKNLLNAIEVEFFQVYKDVQMLSPNIRFLKTGTPQR
jgi:hypothetical protein